MLSNTTFLHVRITKSSHSADADLIMIIYYYLSLQLFAALFFLMMAVLGVGSGVALHSTVNTILLDAFPKVPTIYMSAMTCTAGFLLGLVYVTPVRRT